VDERKVHFLTSEMTSKQKDLVEAEGMNVTELNPVHVEFLMKGISC
jgi:hypothetical protein